MEEKKPQVDCIVTSPPYEGSDLNGKRATPCLERKAELLEAAGIDPKKWLGNARCTQMRNEGYIGSEGQIGETGGETFWAAAKLIVEECAAILRPGGFSAWVVKDFVRNKARVPFCDDWCKLLEACGFTVEMRVHALLVKESRHPDLFGGEKVETKSRKSFFRRLYEKKYPGNAIDFEEVVFACKKETV